MTDLEKVLPADGKLRFYRMVIASAIMVNPTWVQSQFHQRVALVYGDRLLAKDDSFFLDHDYAEVKDTHPNAETIIQKIKECWSTLSAENRDIVWKYIRILVHLCRKIQCGIGGQT